MFARTRSRIEAAVPFPRIGVVRIPDALGNRPDINIAVVNVPAFMAVVCGSAAGEAGMRASKRETWRMATPARDSAPVVPLFGVAVIV
jgi:hypothetical protein